MQNELETLLKDLPIGGIRYFETVGSTNDIAGEWAGAGAADLSLVVGDEQTAGRGRHGRSWHTPAGAALALSVVLHPTPKDSPESLGKYAALGALAVHQAIRECYGLPAQIKWPNDVLINGKKVCGILAESHWEGDQLRGLIVGIGVNVSRAAVPPLFGDAFPASSIETELGEAVNRWELLRAILQNLVTWRATLHSPAFIAAWQGNLAFLDVLVTVGEVRGRIMGLTPKGFLWLRDIQGEEHVFRAGEVHLRPS